ncbi:hypothetical protein ACS0TY_030205 [Phlomoides rotata]
MVIKILASLVVILLLLTVVATTTDYADGICKLLVETRGYTCEEHKVTTEDGYILSVQRIPTGRLGGSETTGAKPPALLQHGLLSDARTWVLNPPDESLGFVLADNGFDVWLANSRGTSYSRGHTSLSPNDPEYWNWSWDELAAYDLTATVQYVYSQTGQTSHYVGHSLGTLIAFAAFSRNEGVNMVRSAAHLCPVAFLGQLASPLLRLAAEALLAEEIYWLGIREFAFGEPPASKLVNAICTRIDCTTLEDVITGNHSYLTPMNQFFRIILVMNSIQFCYI